MDTATVFNSKHTLELPIQQAPGNLDEQDYFTPCGGGLSVSLALARSSASLALHVATAMALPTIAERLPVTGTHFCAKKL